MPVRSRPWRPLQVQLAFLAGLALVLALIPINRWLALRIQAASVKMMVAKDRWVGARPCLGHDCRHCHHTVVAAQRPASAAAVHASARPVWPFPPSKRRVHVLMELLRGIRAVKSYCWQDVFAARVERHRRHELQALAVRKYLDALCVFFWAGEGVLLGWRSLLVGEDGKSFTSATVPTGPSMPAHTIASIHHTAATNVLFSLLTFGLYTLMGRHLTPSVVFTSLALFNMLLGEASRLFS